MFYMLNVSETENISVQKMWELVLCYVNIQSIIKNPLSSILYHLYLLKYKRTQQSVNN